MEKRKPLKVFKLKVPIYDVDLYVLVGDRDAANHWCSRKYSSIKKEPLERRWVYQFTSIDFSSGPSDYIIYLNDFTCAGGEIAALTHEALHATFRILEDVGFKSSMDSEEAYTYLITWIMTEILRRLTGSELRGRKSRKKRRKKRG